MGRRFASSLVHTSTTFWSTVCADAIPSKRGSAAQHPLFLAAMRARAAQLGRPLRLLDVGCGDGRFALELAHFAPAALTQDDVMAGHPLVESVVGVDLSSDGIAAARINASNFAALSRRRSSRNGSGSVNSGGSNSSGGTDDCTWPPLHTGFAVADVCGKLEVLREAIRGAMVQQQLQQQHQQSVEQVLETFDVVLLQLLISVVGKAPQRAALLHNCTALLQGDEVGDDGGLLCLSASGDSAHVNPGYAALYAADRALTGEERTYCSRDETTGEVLYLTHHFTREELAAALTEESLGFCAASLRIAVEEESSSRRPDEKALFMYATAQRRRFESRE